MSDDGLFPKNYGEFLEKRDQAKGYDFEYPTAGNVSPPTVTFAEKLRWWTWGRWKRMKKIREERDRHQQDIIQLKKTNREWPES
jgi:hypothetical protein